MRSFIPIILGVAALYLTIWPHELAHSIAAYLCGCKANWWQTGMSWYLWRSLAGNVDWTCLAAQRGPALGLTGFAGIALTLLFLGLALLFTRVWLPAGHPWLFVGATFWALANYAEAFSYLVLNTLWPKSDMEAVVQESGITRWVWFGAGLLGAFLCGRALRTPVRTAAELLRSPRMSSRAWRRALILYVLVIGLVMGAARVTLM
jgi:hypothetical protein